MCICLLVVTGYEILACYVLPVWRVDATYNSNSPAVPGTRGRAARIVPDPRGRPAPPLPPPTAVFMEYSRQFSGCDRKMYI